MKKRAMSSEQARAVREKGHLKAKEFARLIGMKEDYQNDIKAKKDVIDKNGDAYSVKSDKYWQIFLYSINRIKNDPTFQAMNGIGQLIIDCLDIFPVVREEYLKNKNIYKRKLEQPMVKLKERLLENYRLETFLSKAIFNSGEVQYLTIYPSNDNRFYVFFYKEVLKILKKKFQIKNSIAQHFSQFSNQKVLFKINDKNAGELEVRNDSDIHYKEIKLRFKAESIIKLLLEKITKHKIYNQKVVLCGDAIKNFSKNYTK